MRTCVCCVDTREYLPRSLSTLLTEAKSLTEPKLSGLSNQARQLPSEIHCLTYRLQGDRHSHSAFKIIFINFTSVLAEFMPVYTLCVPGV